MKISEYNKLALRASNILLDIVDMLMPAGLTNTESQWFRAKAVANELKRESERRLSYVRSDRPCINPGQGELFKEPA